MLLRRAFQFTRCGRGNYCQVNGDVKHGDELNDDSSRQGAFSADEVNEEECTDDRGHEFDDTEYSGCKKLL